MIDHSGQFFRQCGFLFGKTREIQGAGIQKRKIFFNFTAQGENFRQAPPQFALELGQSKETLFHMIHVPVSYTHLTLPTT